MTTTTCCLRAYQVVTDYWPEPGFFQTAQPLVLATPLCRLPVVPLPLVCATYVLRLPSRSLPGILRMTALISGSGVSHTYIQIPVFQLPVFGSCRFHLDFLVPCLLVFFFASRHGRSGLTQDGSSMKELEIMQ